MSKEATVENAVAQNAMMQACDELFEGTANLDTLSLPSGLTFELRNARVKHIRSITEFIQEFLGHLQDSEITQIVTALSNHQQTAIEAGVSPYQLGTDKTLSQLLGSAKLVTKLSQLGLESFPRLIPLFSSCTAEQFEDLEIDEAALLAISVFGKNYHFFFQRVRPAVLACIQARIPR